MNDPTEEEEPENARQNELDHGDEESSLEQLAKPWNEETAKRRQNVAARALTRHGRSRPDRLGRLQPVARAAVRRHRSAAGEGRRKTNGATPAEGCAIRFASSVYGRGC
jgi:hypothetical protein